MQQATKIDMSLGDAIDRVSILARKIHFGEDRAINEFSYLTQAIDKLGLKMSGAMVAAIIRIAMANIDIWNLENEIRCLGDPVAKFGLEEIGRRAMLIRDLNKKRITAKNEINRLTGLGHREFKCKHRSQ